MANAYTLRVMSKAALAPLGPPRRITVSEAAEEYLYINSRTRTWDSRIAPYMVEPMNMTTDRCYNTVCFVGPARTGKTAALILGRWVWTVICQPIDFGLIHSSEHLARDFAKVDLARVHLFSPALRDELTESLKEDTLREKIYKSGIRAFIGWPSGRQLASRTVPVMLLTDYGRWPGNVGGEGSGFAQARKRMETAKSLAMCVVESSPGSWVPTEIEIPRQHYELGKPLNHAFPATVAGVRADICPIYNDGDKRWLYVPCISCGEFYPQEPNMYRFAWTESDDPKKAAKTAGTVCCWCGSVHKEDTKRIENANGKWVAQGEIIDCNGNIIDINSMRGKTYPSYALGGGASAYQTRSDIVKQFISARANTLATGDDGDLRFHLNANVGMPYVNDFIVLKNMFHWVYGL